MNTHRMLLSTWLLSLSLILGSCYSLQNIRTERLNTEKLTQRTRYWIAGAYLTDGTYQPFDKKSDVVRLKYQLSESYEGGIWAGDTLYGVSFSEPLAIPVDQIEKLRVHRPDVFANILFPVILGGVLIYKAATFSFEINWDWGG